MKKISVLFLASVIASAGMGVGYAVTNGDVNPLSVNSDVFFVGYVTPYDNEVEKDIGTVTAELADEYSSGYYETVSIEIYSAYPSYTAYVDFFVENTGADPEYVYGFVSELQDYDHDAMSITLEGNLASTVYLDPGEIVCGTVNITVLNDALQSHTYHFTVGLAFGSLPP